MDPELYDAAIKGNIAVLVQYKDELAVQVTPNNNTVVHVVALFKDNSHLVKEIIKMQPLLLCRVNSRGDTPLHIAAREGHGNVVQALVECAKEMTDMELESEIGVAKKMLRMTNKDGNTALHEAVWNGNLDTVTLLVNEDPDFPHSANNADETPLYLAAERGFDDVLLKILNTCTSPAYIGPDRTTALHGAVANDSEGCTTQLIQWKQSLTTESDNRGWMPLHYAAKLGHSSRVKQLLDVDKSLAYLTTSVEDNKMTPLQIAAKCDKVKVMKELISCCQDCWEIVDSKGQNILHLATSHQQIDAIEFILEDFRFGSLINQKDDEGNTPLHLCASDIEKWITFRFVVKNPRVNKGINKGIYNKKNWTPLDIVYNKDPIKRQEYLARKGFQLGKRNVVDRSYSWNVNFSKSDVERKREGERRERREKFNSHLIVAAFIATVTFAAGFTVPGGYDGNQGPNQGMAVLTRAAAFKAFVIFDTIAMILSTISVFLHFIISLYDDDFKYGKRIIIAFFFIVLAMVAMVVAFMTGMYAVLGHSLGIAITVCLLGSFSIVLLFYLLWRLFVNEML